MFNLLTLKISSHLTGTLAHCSIVVVVSALTKQSRSSHRPYHQTLRYGYWIPIYRSRLFISSKFRFSACDRCLYLQRHSSSSSSWGSSSFPCIVHIRWCCWFGLLLVVLSTLIVSIEIEIFLLTSIPLFHSFLLNNLFSEKSK